MLYFHQTSSTVFFFSLIVTSFNYRI